MYVSIERFCFFWFLCIVIVKNSENYLHGGAIGIFVDLVGSAAIYTMGTRHSGISMEISVTYLDAAYIDVSISPLELHCFVCCFNFKSHILRQP